MLKYKLVFFMTVLSALEIIASSTEEKPNEDLKILTEGANGSTIPTVAAENLNQDLTLSENILKKEKQLQKPKYDPEQDGLKKVNSSEEDPSPKTDIVSRLFKHFDVNNWDQLHEKLPQLKSPPSEKFLQALESGSTEQNDQIKNPMPNANSSENLTNERRKGIPTVQSEELSVSSENKSIENAFPDQTKLEVTKTASVPKPTNKSIKNTFPNETNLNVIKSMQVPTQIDKDNENTFPNQTKLNVLKSIIDPKPISQSNENAFPDLTKQEVINKTDTNYENVFSNDTNPEDIEESSLDETKGNQTETSNSVDNGLTVEGVDDDEFSNTEEETIATTEHFLAKSENKSETFAKQNLSSYFSELKANLNKTLPLTFSKPKDTIGLRSLDLANKFESLKSILKNSGTDKLKYNPSRHNENASFRASTKKPGYYPRFKPLPLPFLYGGVNKKRNEQIRKQQQSITSKSPSEVNLNKGKKQTVKYPIQNENTADPKFEGKFIPRKEKTPDTKDTPVNEKLDENKPISAQDAAKLKENTNGTNNEFNALSNKSITVDQSLVNDKNISNIQNKAAPKPGAIPDTMKNTNPPKNGSGKTNESVPETSLKSVTQVLMEKIANLEALINKTNADKMLNTKTLVKSLNESHTDFSNEENRIDVQNIDAEKKNSGISQRSQIRPNALRKRNVINKSNMTTTVKPIETPNKFKTINPSTDDSKKANKSKKKQPLKNKPNEITTESEPLSSFESISQILMDKIANLEKLINQSNVHNLLNKSDEDNVTTNAQIVKDKTKNNSPAYKNITKEPVSQYNNLASGDDQNKTPSDDEIMSIKDDEIEKKNKQETLNGVSNRSQEMLTNNFTVGQSDLSYRNISKIAKNDPVEIPDMLKLDNPETNSTQENNENINKHASKKYDSKENETIPITSLEAPDRSTVFNPQSNSTKKNNNNNNKHPIKKPNNMENETIPIISLENIAQMLIDKINHLEKIINETNAVKTSSQKQPVTFLGNTPSNKSDANKSQVSQKKVIARNPSAISRNRTKENLITSTLRPVQIEITAATQPTTIATTIHAANLGTSSESLTASKDLNAKVTNLSSQRRGKSNVSTTVASTLRASNNLSKPVSHHTLGKDPTAANSSQTKSIGSFLPKPTTPMYPKLQNLSSHKNNSSISIPRNVLSDELPNPSLNITSPSNLTASRTSVTSSLKTPHSLISKTLHSPNNKANSTAISKNSSPRHSNHFKFKGTNSSASPKLNVYQHSKSNKFESPPKVLQTLLSILKPYKTPEKLTPFNLRLSKIPSKSFVNPSSNIFYPSPSNNFDYSRNSRYFTPQKHTLKHPNSFDLQDRDDLPTSDITHPALSTSVDYSNIDHKADLLDKDRPGDPFFSSEFSNPSFIPSYSKYLSPTRPYRQMSDHYYGPYKKPPTDNFHPVFSDYNPNTGVHTKPYAYYSPRDAFFKHFNVFEPFDQNFFDSSHSTYYSPHSPGNGIMRYNPQLKQRGRRSSRLQVDRNPTHNFQDSPRYGRYFFQPTESQNNHKSRGQSPFGVYSHNRQNSYFE